MSARLLVEPTREAALQQLAGFVPKSGRSYAASRNYDLGPGDRSNVSTLSPYVRHRLVTEQEIVDAVLSRFALSTAEKFVQEVCWRTYWKGWLEQRPGVWHRYRDELSRLETEITSDPAHAQTFEGAIAGETGIDCFDAWVRELVETGYLHNHARMWFASIWVFTLGLPWQLGADFFMRHLLDGDPASNTLSWRWVCGLHTVGKTYLARAANIAEYTNGRFNPKGKLATAAQPLPIADLPRPTGLRTLAPLPQGGPLGLLLTEEDLTPETMALPESRIAAVFAVDTAEAYPRTSHKVVEFRRAALLNAAERIGRSFGAPLNIVASKEPSAAAQALDSFGCTALVTSEIPVGPAKEAILAILNETKNVSLYEMRRPWDAAFWPYATAGFFKIKERIPAILQDLGSHSVPREPRGA